MRKALLSFSLAAVLVATLVGVATVHAPQVYAASCSSTYWQFNSDATVNLPNGYHFELQLMELRDSYNSNYCGRVYTRAGLLVPAHTSSYPTVWFKVYNISYRNGGWVGTTSNYFYNVPTCCASGPYFVNSNSFAAASGAKVSVVGQADDDTGGTVGSNGTDFWVY